MECCAGVKSLTGGAGHSHGSMPSNCTDWSSTSTSHLAGVVLVYSKLLLLSIRWAAARVKRESWEKLFYHAPVVLLAVWCIERLF